MNEFWKGFEKVALVGAGLKLVGKALAGSGKFVAKNPVKSLFGGLTAHDMGSAASRGSRMVSAGKGAVSAMERGRKFVGPTRTF